MDKQGSSVRQPTAVGLLLVLAISWSSAAQGISPPFEAATVVADNQTRFEALLDYDADGKMDTVSVWFPTTLAITVKGHRNDGTGKLVPDWSTTHTGIMNPPSSGPVAVLGTGDFNADGFGDFVLTLNQYVGYWISNGAGVVPAVQWVSPEPAVINELVAADFDGDGRTDVALREGLDIRVFMTQASGPPVMTSSVQVGSTATTHIFKTEANGDGLPDVGATQYGSPLATGVLNVLLYALPGGVAQTPLQFQFTNAAGPMTVSGDVDGDGDTDVVAFSMPVGNALALYQLARRVGPASFNVEAQTTGGPATHLVDLDFDGDLDGACCGGGGGGPATNTAVSKFELSINVGGGAFAPAFVIPSMGAVHFAGASDLDSDGDVDLVAGRCVYYSGGPGSLPPYSAAGGVTGPGDVADIDGDGDPDAKPGLATTWSNAGNGVFTSQPVMAPPPPPGLNWSLPGFPGDFDGDGDTDLLCDTLGQGGVPTGTHFLANRGSGVYVDQGPAVQPGLVLSALPGPLVFPWVANQPENSVVADLDLDGDQDIVVRGAGAAVTSASWNSKVWINAGGGSFVPGPDLIGVVVVAAGLIDQDAIVDLVAHQHVTSGFSDLVILTGTAAGYVPGPVLDGDTHVLNRPAVYDYDGDGDLDVVSFGNGALRRYTNLGNTFSATTAFPGLFAPPTSSGPFSPAAPRLVFPVDVDVDGLLDVVVTPLADVPGGMAMLDSATVSAWSGAVTLQVFEPRAFTDLDGDGDQDALGPFTASRNKHFGPIGAGRRVQYGAGIPGTGGITPIAGEVGPFRAGQLGELRFRGGLGGASGLLAIGFSAANIPMSGGTLLVNPSELFPIQLGGPAGLPGAGSLSIPFVIPASLVGLSIFHQAGFFDPGSPAGISGTNGLQIDIGQ